MLAADKQSDSTGSGKAHCPSDPASTWGPVAAKGSSQVVEPGAFSLLSRLCPTEPAYWGLWGLQCFSSPFQLMSGLLPTSHPPRVLTSAVFPATQRLWLHTESCAVSRRPTPIGVLETHAYRGISPVRFLWQLQGHRKVTAGETQRECEEGSASPAHTVWSPSQGDRKAWSLHKQDPDTTKERLGCRWVSPYTLHTGLPRLEQGFSVLAAH